MTENNTPAFDMEALLAAQDARRARAAELLVLNKACLLSTFAEAGIPSFADWVRCIRPERWMSRAQPLHKLVDPFAEPLKEAA